MPYNISEIKKPSTKEELQVIDEIWETIETNDENAEDTFDEDPEVIALLQERIERYERGEGVSYSWEEAKEIINKKLEDFRKIRND